MRSGRMTTSSSPSGPATSKNGKPSRLLKKVSCVTGEKLETRSREYYCDGEYLGMAKWYSLKGEPVDSFVYSGTVPEGKLFVTGRHRGQLRFEVPRLHRKEKR